MLILQMDTIGRQVCLSAGGDTFARGEDVETILKTSREYIQPDASGHVYQQMAELLQYKRADQAIGRYLLESDVFRREAEARVVMGGAFPDTFVSSLSMQNAAFSRAEKSLVLATVRGVFGFPHCCVTAAPIV